MQKIAEFFRYFLGNSRIFPIDNNSDVMLEISEGELTKRFDDYLNGIIMSHFTNSSPECVKSYNYLIRRDVRRKAILLLKRECVDKIYINAEVKNLFDVRYLELIITQDINNNIFTPSVSFGKVANSSNFRMVLNFWPSDIGEKQCVSLL